MKFLDGSEPLEVLEKFQDSELKKALKNAKHSLMYENYKFDEEMAIAEMQTLPFLKASQYQEMFWKHSEGIFLSKPRFWYCTSGTTGGAKWFPRTKKDMDAYVGFDFEKIRGKYFTKEEVVLNLTKPLPIGSGSVTLGLPSYVEEIPAYPHVFENALRLAEKRKPTAIFGVPSIIMTLFDLELDGKRAMDFLKQVKKIVFLAEGVGTNRGIFEKLFKTKEIYETYGSVELGLIAYECGSHSGMHLNEHMGKIFEIIPQDELKKEMKKEGYVPKALNVNHVGKGTVGELVATVFWEVLPLFRYRTSDLVEVQEGFSSCGCGCRYPRIKVLGRRDEMLKVGGETIYAAWLHSALKSDFSNGIIIDYRMIMDEREKVLTFKLKASSKNEERFASEVKSKVFETIDKYSPGVLTREFIEKGMLKMNFEYVKEFEKTPGVKPKKFLIKNK